MKSKVKSQTPQIIEPNEAINWDDGIIDKMPIKDQERIAKKFEREILKLKQTLAGRRRLARAFGGNHVDYK